jgi:hypothetical protein
LVVAGFDPRRAPLVLEPLVRARGCCRRKWLRAESFFGNPMSASVSEGTPSKTGTASGTGFSSAWAGLYHRAHLRIAANEGRVFGVGIILSSESSVGLLARNFNCLAQAPD